MALASLRQLPDHAAEHISALPALNMNNMEQRLAIMAAAVATNSPVIMQASRGARAFANDLVLSHLIRALPTYPCAHASRSGQFTRHMYVRDYKWLFVADNGWFFAT